MFFELHNTKVVVTEQGLMNASIKRLYDSDTGKNRDRFYKMASYIFYVYDKRSIYSSMSLSDRQKLVSNDIVMDPDYWKSVEENSTFKEIVDKLNSIQFNHKERLLEGVKKKIDEYLDVFNGMSITEKNYKDHQAMAKGSQDLLELYDKLEQMVSKEALSKQVGGGTARMFEDE
jgi:hypothetical protein